MKQLLYTLFFLSLFYPNISSATHLSGGEMYYESISPCVYRIHIKILTDCNGASTSLPPINNNSLIPSNITFTGSGPSGCNATPQMIGNWIFVQNIDISPMCPSSIINNSCNGGSLFNGTAQSYYYADFDICQPGPIPCNTFDVSWSGSGRKSIITSGAANQGIFVDIQIIRDSSLVNSSPVFNSPPQTFFCSGSPTILDHSATDPDGDSLVFVLSDAFQAANTPVTYNAGYSAQQFLAGSWNTSIDPTTGLVSVVPNPNGFPVVGVIRVDVKEYRNGVYLGQISRDVELSTNSFGCTSVNSVDLSGIQNLINGSLINPDKIEICEGVTTTFEFTATDLDVSDSIGIISNISTTFPNALLTQTGINPATYSVSITPGPQHSGNTYSVFVKATDNRCPFPTYDSYSFSLKAVNACITSQITATNCNASTGAIDITFTNGVSPIQYLWNTGDTTEDLANIPSGIYTVYAVDAIGKTLNDTFFVNSIDIMISTTLTQPSCDNFDGAVFPLISGGTMPYSYSWNTGSTAPSIGNLPDGGYAVYVWDSLNCFNHKAVILDEPDSCYVEVSGKVYIDVNTNCIFDSSDYPISNALVSYLPVYGGAVFTDNQGNYTFKVDTGTYSVKYHNPNYQFPPSQCSPGNTQILSFTSYDDDTVGVDFPIDSITIKDVAIAGVYNPNLKPGFTQNYLVAYSNPGTVTSSGTISAILDSNIVFENSFPIGTYDSTAHTITVPFSNLTSGQLNHIFIQVSTPATVSVGTPVNSTFVISPFGGDNSLWNNTFIKSDSVVSSYDPNDKQVTPRGIGSQGFIQTTDSLLTYNVRFQNTGNFPATFVIIEDIIDDNLDIGSIIQGPHSHPYVLSIEDGNKLIFTFNNINLPDSTTDLAGSQGFVQFTLKQKPNLSVGTVITNQASIIFDFNVPVITNQVTNTIFTYPKIAIIAGPDTLCEGEEIGAELTGLAMKPYTYDWQPLSQTFQTPDSVHAIGATDSDLYTVIVTDAFGFSDTASQYINVIKNPVSDFTYQANSLTVDFTDNSDHATTWMWDFGDGNTSTDQSPQHIFAKDSTYEVVLITSNECKEDTSKQAIEVFSNVSIDDQAFRNSVRIAPNPFSESVMISFDNPSLQPMELKLMDAKGRVIIHRKAERTNQFVIQNQGLSAGIYIVELIGVKRFVGKVMVR